jgi:hypothetical protein
VGLQCSLGSHKVAFKVAFKVASTFFGSDELFRRKLNSALGRGTIDGRHVQKLDTLLDIMAILEILNIGSTTYDGKEAAERRQLTQEEGAMRKERKDRLQVIEEQQILNQLENLREVFP